MVFCWPRRLVDFLNYYKIIWPRKGQFCFGDCILKEYSHQHKSWRKGVHTMDEKMRKGLEILLGKKLFEALEGKLSPRDAVIALGKAEDEWKRISKILMAATERCRESQAILLEQGQAKVPLHSQK